MLHMLGNILSSAYAQELILIILLAYYFTHRKGAGLVSSGVNMLRTTVLIVVFIFLMLNQASAVNPSLRSASVAGMFIVNLYMLYNLILMHFETPYRLALAELGREPQRHELMHQVWRSGKRFFYADYLFSSLYSGTAPWAYLRDMATDRVRTDIRESLKRYGMERRLTNLQTMVAYLRNLVDCDRELPQDFKDVIDSAIEQFSRHPWIEENVNNFLALALETPEDLHYPEWKASWEKCITQV